jgi:hypothetical protein
MRLLTMGEVEHISNDWLAVACLPIPVQDAFWYRLQVPCKVVMPLGELMNPNLAGYAWVWKLKECIHPEPITDKHRFNANGLEGCFSLGEMLSTAILIYREVPPDRINIFVPNGFRWESSREE